jgi:Transmembrane proteins 230/134
MNDAKQRRNTGIMNSQREQLVTETSSFRLPESDKPWESVVWAIVLLVVGFVLSIVGLVLWVTDSLRAGGWVLFLGLFVWIPGGYVSFVAWKAYHGHSGYSIRDIPIFQ